MNEVTFRLRAHEGITLPNFLDKLLHKSNDFGFTPSPIANAKLTKTFFTGLHESFGSMGGGTGGFTHQVRLRLRR
jgi:hypothetical protein